MNPWLAEIYGTDGADDIEKTAQYALLQKLAADENLDLSQFSPEELQQLLAEVLGDEGAAEAMGAVPGQALQQPGTQQPPVAGQDMNPTQLGGQAPRAFAPAAQAPQQVAPQVPAAVMQQQAPQQDQAALQKEAAAKFEEADMLGRVMAHAYTQELEKIAASKTAGKMDAVKGALNSAKNRAGHMAERGAAKVRSYGTAAGMKGRDAAGKAGAFGKKNKGAIGAAAGGAAAGFAAGRMSKEASAFEKLAEMQAAEILSATGYDPSTGVDTFSQPDQAQGQEQQAPEQVSQFLQQGQPAVQEQDLAGQQQAPVAQEEFATALDNRALEMLAEAGYDVNEIIARLQLAQGQGTGEA